MSQIETTDIGNDNSDLADNIIKDIMLKEHYYIITYRFATKKEYGTYKKRKIYDKFIDFVEKFQNYYNNAGKGILDDTTSTAIIKTFVPIVEIKLLIEGLYNSEYPIDDNDFITIIESSKGSIGYIMQLADKKWKIVELDKLLEY